MNPEIRTAKKWYWWLWLSPLLTIPTLFALFYLLESGRWIDVLTCGGRVEAAVANYSLDLGIDPSTPTTLYAGLNGVYKSADGGENWKAFSLSGFYANSLEIDPSTPTTLYAGTGNGVYQSTDGGESWRSIGLSGKQIYSLAIDPSTPTTLYAGTGNGVFKSTDGAKSWEICGLSGDYVMTLAINPSTPTTLYAGLNDGLFKSTDGGESWNASGLLRKSVYSLAIDPMTHLTLYAGTVIGVFKSTDGGETWKNSGLYGAEVHSLAIDQSSPTTLYAGSFGLASIYGDSTNEDSASGVFKSIDGGESWRASGMSGDYVHSLAVDPSTPTTLYAGTRNGIYKSTDGGGVWQNCKLPASLEEPIILILGLLGSALWHMVLLVPARNKQSEFIRWHGRQALLLAGIRTAIPLIFLLILGISKNDILDSFEILPSFLLIFFLLSFLFSVWLFGNLWGQRQAGGGDCALMRWTGHGAGLPLPVWMAEAATEPGKTTAPAAIPIQSPVSEEKPDYPATYNQGVELRQSGKAEEALAVYLQLLASEATPEIKARVAEELKEIDGAYENSPAEALVAILRYSPDPELRLMALARLKEMGLVEGMQDG